MQGSEVGGREERSIRTVQVTYDTDRIDRYELFGSNEFPDSIYIPDHPPSRDIIIVTTLPLPALTVTD